MNNDPESDQSDFGAGEVSALAATGAEESQPAKTLLSQLGSWLSIGSCALQMVGILIATILGVWEIRSIIFSGPLLAATGLLFAGISYAKNRLVGLYFGLGAPSVAVLCFAIIFGLHWSPGTAQVPISSLLVICATVLIPAGGFAIRELRRDRVIGSRSARFQFSIKSMFILTALVAVLCRLAFLTSNAGLASAVFVAYFVVLIYVLRRFHRCRRVSDDNKPLAASDDGLLGF